MQSEQFVVSQYSFMTWESAHENVYINYLKELSLERPEDPFIYNDFVKEDQRSSCYSASTSCQCLASEWTCF